MYDAIDVADYIVYKHFDELISITKLVKLLYFIQAHYLVDEHRPCFRDAIEAWDFGPVVAEVWREYARYGNGTIPKTAVKKRFDLKREYSKSRGRMFFSENSISDEDKEIIDEVVLFFAPYSATSLTDLTMNQAPWVDAYNTGEKIISSESLIDYFGTSRTSEAV